MELSKAVSRRIDNNQRTFALAGVGFLSYHCLLNVYRFLRFMLNHFSGPKVKFTKLGQYAVITGSTDGIGKAYAFELAKHGMNLVLISRTQSRLDDTAGEIQKLYHDIVIKTIAADFEQNDIYDRIENELAGLDIGVLVNNVAAVINKPMMPLHRLSRDELYRAVNCNILSAIQMTRIVLPSMVAKKRGAIINMSSAAAIFPPLFGLYSISKTLMRQFSCMLRLQYARRGLIIQEVEPMFVDTKMASELLSTPLAKVSRFVFSSPQAVAKQSLATLGRCDETHGTLLHTLQGVFFASIPDLSPLLQKLISYGDGRARKNYPLNNNDNNAPLK